MANWVPTKEEKRAMRANKAKHADLPYGCKIAWDRDNMMTVTRVLPIDSDVLVYGYVNGQARVVRMINEGKVSFYN